MVQVSPINLAFPDCEGVSMWAQNAELAPFYLLSGSYRHMLVYELNIIPYMTMSR